MAEEYIADVIRQGAKAIEAWRKKHPNAPIMLVGLDLSKINLVGANLSGANVTGCNLHMALLIGTNLSKAKLAGAKLRGANMVGADLSSADLSNAVLTGALLQRANLQGANLSGANLRRADVRGALLRGANFNDADLDGVVMTDAEKTYIEGGGEAPAGADGVPASRAALDTVGFTLQLGKGVSAIDLARLLKALDDVHVLIGLSPVLVDRLVLVSAQTGGDPSGNCLVVRLDGKASAWLQDALGSNILALSSPQARILRYKKLGLSEEDVWHNVRPLMENGDDALAVLREMFQKSIILSFGGAVPVEATVPPPTAAHVPAAPGPPPAPAAPHTAAPPPSAAASVSPDVSPELKACIEQLQSKDWNDRSAAAEKLGNMGRAAQAAMPYLMMAAEDENFFVREAAEDAIKKITGQG